MKKEIILVPVHQRQEIAEVKLNQDSNLIGSDAGCTHEISASGIAPRHCEINHDGTHWILHALDPKTWLNGGPARRISLKNRDRLAIGPVEFEVKEVSVEEKSPAEESQLNNNPLFQIELASPKAQPKATSSELTASNSRPDLMISFSKDNFSNEIQESPTEPTNQEAEEDKSEWKSSYNSDLKEINDRMNRSLDLIERELGQQQGHFDKNPNREEVKPSKPNLIENKSTPETDEKLNLLSQKEMRIRELEESLQEQLEDILKREQILSEEQNHFEVIQSEFDEQFQQWSSEYHKEKESIENLKSSFETRQEQINKQVEILRVREEELKKQQTEQTAEYEFISAEKKSLAEEREQLLEKSQKLDEEADRLSEVRSELEELEETRIKLQDEKEELESSRNELQEKIDELDQKEKQVREELNSSTENLNDLQKEVDSEKEELLLQKEQIKEEKTNLEQVKAELEEQKEKLIELQSELEAKELELKELHKSNQEQSESTEQELLEARKEIQLEKESLLKQSEELKELQQEWEEEKKELDSEREELRNQLKQVEQEKSDLEEQQEKLIELQNELEEKELELKDLQDSSQEQSASTEQELQLAKEEIQLEKESLLKQSEELKELQHGWEEEKKELEAEKEQLEIQLKQVEQEKAELDSEKEDFLTQKKQIEEEKSILLEEKGKLEQDRIHFLEDNQEMKKKEELFSELKITEQNIEDEKVWITSEKELLAREKSEFEVLKSEFDQKVSDLEEEKALVQSKLNELNEKSLEQENSSFGLEQDEAFNALPEELKTAEQSDHLSDEEHSEEIAADSNNESDTVSELHSTLASMFDLPESERGEHPNSEPVMESQSDSIESVSGQVLENEMESGLEEDNTETEPVAGESNSEEETPSEDNVPDDIQAYMARILGKKIETPAQDENPKPDSQTPESQQTHGNQDMMDQLKSSLPTDSEPETEIPLTQLPTPRVKLDMDGLRSNINSLREVANFSARSAIAKHDTVKSQGTLSLKIILACGAFGLAAILYFSSSMGMGAFSKQITASFLIGIILSIELTRNFYYISKANKKVKESISQKELLEPDVPTESPATIELADSEPEQEFQEEMEAPNSQTEEPVEDPESSDLDSDEVISD